MFSPADLVSSEAAFQEDYVLGMGDSLEIPCDLDGPPHPVVWFKDGAGVVPSNRTLIGQRLLRIINVSYEDSGVYTCWLARTNLLLSNFTVRVTGDGPVLFSCFNHRKILKTAEAVWTLSWTIAEICWKIKVAKGLLKVKRGRMMAGS